MVKRYRVDSLQRAVNAIFTALTKAGLGARYRHLLTVVGRRSGLPRTTPVDVMRHDGAEWLVAPYGEVNWVRNLRAAGTCELRRGRRRQTCQAHEVSPRTAVPVVRQYMAQVPVTRSYWAVEATASDQELEAEAARHPVFRLTPTASAR